MSVVNAIPLIAAGDDGYNLTRSLRFRSSASAYLSRTPATASNRKTWTWSGWVKRGKLATQQFVFSCYVGSSDANEFQMQFTSSDTIEISAYATVYRVTSQVFRDPAAWYHIALAVDTTQATAANRLLLYINGVQVTAFSTNNNPSQNTDFIINSANEHHIGYFTASVLYYDGYMAEVNFIDGQALAPTAFGTVNSYGVWQPITYGGSYGNNGFRLPFTNNASTTTLGLDFSPQGNNWTTNNISVTAGVTYDSMTDVPTLTSATAANFATLNPLIPSSALTNGNLNVPSLSFNATATQQVGSGKWYCEFTLNGGSSYNYFLGVYTPDLSTSYLAMGLCNGGNSPNIFSCNTNTNGTVTQPTGSRPTQPAVIGIKLDIGAGSIEFLVNGTVNGSITGVTNWQSGKDWVFFASNYTSTFGYQPLSANFGQQPFVNALPTGFLALNTFNL